MTLGEVRINRGVREYTGHRTGEGGKRMQAKEGGQNFLHGALILAASALIVKLIGADVLPDDQKLIIEVAKLVRTGFLPISSAAPAWVTS